MVAPTDSVEVQRSKERDTMKKLLILMLILVLLLTGCAGNGQTDEPADVQKDEPVVDQNKDEPEQDACEALGHDMAEATCENPSACSRCGLTEGAALGHDMAEATCVTPAACTRCDKTEGEALGHSWADATYDAPKTCTLCGKTEGEKLSRPTYTTGQIESAGIYEELVQLTDYLVGQDSSLTYDEETNLLHFVLTPNNGAANAYSQRGDNWGLYTAYLKMLTAYGQLSFRDEGIDIDVQVTLRDDRDPSKVLYEVINQEVLTDVYEKLVPEILKTQAFYSIFYTVNANYLFIEKTAAYDAASSTLVFYLCLDGNTAFHIKSLAGEGKLEEYKMWSGLTDAIKRWSLQGHEDFAKAGEEIRCAVLLLDGSANNDPLFAARNGEVIFSIE